MRFKKTKIKLAVYLVGLVLSLTTLSWLLANTDYYASISIMFTISLGLTYRLWRTLNSQLDTLSNFFRALKYEDFSSKLSTGALGKDYVTLTKELNLIADKLSDSKQAVERQKEYLKAILEHIETSVIAYDSQGEISLLNRSAQRLFNKRHIKNIDELETTQNALHAWLTGNQQSGSHICSCTVDDYPQQLLVEKAQARIDNAPLWIVTLQNIQSALDDKEVTSWQEITRVLTHEISNSITPITSLASSCKSMLSGPLDDEDIVDLQEAIETIEKRGDNLVSFIDNYRKLTKLPKLNLKRTAVLSLVKQIQTLYKQDLLDNNIQFDIESDTPDIQVMLDPVLVEQVLVNLVKNAIAAVEEVESPKIIIRLKTNKDNLSISVIDNGKGILKEALPKVFIPFYTTKHQGSGIGLSLSKLIMQLHNGSISVRSELDKGSEFTLKF